MRKMRWIAAALLGAGLVALAVVTAIFVQRMTGAGGPLAMRMLLSGLEETIARQEILETQVDVDIDPDSQYLQGTAELRMRYDLGLTTLCFLLNPGLRVTQAEICGESAAFERDHLVLRITIPGICDPSEEADVRIGFEGQLAATPLASPVFTPEEAILPALTFWYPLDLHSFSIHSVQISVPQEFTVAGAVAEQVEEGAPHRFQWSAERPVWGASIAAGKYHVLRRAYGGVECALYSLPKATAESEALLQTLGNVHGFQASAYGDSGFDEISLVISEANEQPFYGGNALAVLPRDALLLPNEDRLLDVARLTAQIWWGGTVGVRWFSNRPEAARWMAESLPVFSAWQTLEHFAGRRAFLRTIERLEAPNTIHTPLNQWSLAERFEEEGEASPFITVRGPFVAGMIAQVTGKEAFNTGCRNFFAVHRYRTASYAALRHELELAAEQDLEEFFRLWFDRGGTFDYGIQNVETIDDLVTVTVHNEGDIAALLPLEIALISDQAAQVRELTPGAYTNTYTFTTSTPVTRVVLDPYFATADMARGNNVWPRRVWPLHLAASTQGSFAVSVRSEWHGPADALAVWPRDGDPPQWSSLPVPLEAQPLWSPSGSSLALPSAVPAVWDLDLGLRLCRNGGAVFGWRGEALWLFHEGMAGPAGPEVDFQPLVPLSADPALASMRAGPNGRLAWLGVEEGYLHLLAEDTTEPAELQTAWQPAGDMAWAGDSEKLVFLTRGGNYRRGDPAAEEMPALLSLEYPVQHSAVSPEGSYLAWLDGNGSLRVLQDDRIFPRLIPVPGEIQAMSWEGEAALLCLVTQSSRLLPMRFHSDYLLHRIPVSTWEAEEVEVAMDTLGPAGPVTDGAVAPP